MLCRALTPYPKKRTQNAQPEASAYTESQALVTKPEAAVVQPEAPTTIPKKSSKSKEPNQQRPVGGPLRTGLDKLTRSVERGVDRQILGAQVRAYGMPPSTSSSKQTTNIGSIQEKHVAFAV